MRRDWLIIVCQHAGDLDFFFYTFFFAVIATLSINVEASLNGLFEGLVLRCCTIGGFILMLLIPCFHLAVHSRIAPWDITRK